MVVASYRLRENFAPQDVVGWCRDAEPGEMISVALPGRASSVRLIRGMNECVCWWPEGGRSLTVPIEDAVQRLAMF